MNTQAVVAAAFQAPIFAGSLPVVCAPVSLVAVATYDSGTFTANAAVTVAAVSAMLSAEFIAPVFAAAGLLTADPIGMTGVATFQVPVYTAESVLMVGDVSAVGLAVYTPILAVVMDGIFSESIFLGAW